MLADHVSVFRMENTNRTRHENPIRLFKIPRGPFRRRFPLPKCRQYHAIKKNRKNDKKEKNKNKETKTDRTEQNMHIPQSRIVCVRCRYRPYTRKPTKQSANQRYDTNLKKSYWLQVNENQSTFAMDAWTDSVRWSVRHEVRKNGVSAISPDRGKVHGLQPGGEGLP